MWRHVVLNDGEAWKIDCGDLSKLELVIGLALCRLQIFMRREKRNKSSCLRFNVKQ